MTIKIEDYNPADEQFHAQVQGIYETLVKKYLGLPYDTPFKSRGTRLDIAHDLDKKTINQLVGNAFAIANKVGQKYGYLNLDSSDPTVMGKVRAAARVGYSYEQIRSSLMLDGYEDDMIEFMLEDLPQMSRKDRFQNILDYEMTLALRRKVYHRILKMKEGRKNVYFVMPEGIRAPNQKEAIKILQDLEEGKSMKSRKKVANPRKMKLPPQSAKLRGSVILCYETRKCNLTAKQMSKAQTEADLYKKTEPLVGRAEDFSEARAHANAAIGRNMCRTCIIFAIMSNGSVRLVDGATGTINTISDFKAELGGKRPPRGSL